VAICQFGIDPRSSTPSWHKRLARNDSCVHPEWLKLLSDSPVVNFDRERVGVVVDVARCDWIHLATYMMKASIPLWFYWGKIPYYVTPLESWISAHYDPDYEKIIKVVPLNAGKFPPVESGSCYALIA